MRIDSLTPAFSGPADSLEMQAGNRRIVQAVRILNSSQQLGDSRELVFSLDGQTRRPVIRVVNRITREVLQQIPNEQILRMAEDLKISGR